MNDERYVFITDCAEKKRIARGSFNKVRGGGKTVRMPSDYLTRKEKRELNGEVSTYNMNAPMDWSAFKKMPDAIQVEYVEGLRRKHGANSSTLAKMFGVDAVTVRHWGNAHNVKFPRGNSTKVERGKWEQFLDGAGKPSGVTEAEAEPVEIPMPVVIPELPKAMEADAPIKSTADMKNIAALLSMLSGSGAKLTIEVTL